MKVCALSFYLLSVLQVKKVLFDIQKNLRKNFEECMQQLSKHVQLRLFEVSNIICVISQLAFYSVPILRQQY